MYGFFYDPTYILIIISLLIAMWASFNVSSTFKKYNKVRIASGMTGAEAARRILDSEGLHGVKVERVAGNLSDHYDPRKKVLRLSDSTHDSTSVAAVSVAAHECGHAVQDANGYLPLVMRTVLVPIANIGSKLYWLLIMIGLLFTGSSSELFIKAGIWMFAAAVLLQIITLPVEFDASGRAIKIMRGIGITRTEDEARISRKVLGAAALTYVAATITAALQLLRLLLLFGGRDRE